MYLNGCLTCPPVVPLEFALNYWTSYSAYHEAAYAALMNSKPDAVRPELRHTFPRIGLPSRGDEDGEPPQSSEQDGIRHSDTPSRPKPLPHSIPHPDPLGQLKRLSPESAMDTSNGADTTNRALDFSKKSDSQQTSPGELKFGISRILSDKVGSKENESGKVKERKSRDNHFVPTSCPCSSPSCPYVVCRRMSGLTSSLSAVHALRPPQYPVTSGTDALPGPYSVLNTDSSCPSHPKRKRSWSRAVFSQLQRKGLEKRFEVQKYVTKPDRRQLAAMLGLTDAQVKVWFQNRRMKWRHAEKSAQQQTSPEDTNEKPEHASAQTEPCPPESLMSDSVSSSPCPGLLSSEDEGGGVEPEGGDMTPVCGPSSPDRSPNGLS